MTIEKAKVGMTHARERAIAELRRMVLCAIGDHDAAVWLFGSCARGDVKGNSDIDIGVLPREEISPEFFADLAARIEDSEIPYDVDLFDLRYVEPALMGAVQREGVMWRK